AAGRRSHVGPNARRAVAKLRLRPVDRDVQSSASLNLLRGERRTRPDHDRVRRRLAAKGIDRASRRHAEPAALTRREAPEAGVPAQLATVLVHDRTVRREEPLPTEEVAVVATCQEACLLALRARRRL